MQREDFPALYRSADDASLAAQSNFFRWLKIHLIALVVAAVFSMINSSNMWATSSQFVVLLFALGCSVYLFAFKPDRLWYLGRAVAESVKTITWRYACRAEPFEIDDTSADVMFLSKVKAVFDQNREFAKRLEFNPEHQQITAKMRFIRQESLDERKRYYTSERILDQLDWYTRKSKLNRRLSRGYFWCLVGVNSLAVILAGIRIAYPTLSVWPTDVFIAISAGILTWMQARRYSELASSYELAAYEISLIRDRVESSSTEHAFSIFVGDAENAFSREHTQWVARRDV